MDWDENAGSPFNNPESVSGMDFWVSTYPDSGNMGTIWVDELALVGDNTVNAESEPMTADETDNAPLHENDGRGLRLPCWMAFILPVMLVSGGSVAATRIVKEITNTLNRIVFLPLRIGLPQVIDMVFNRNNSYPLCINLSGAFLFDMHQEFAFFE